MESSMDEEGTQSPRSHKNLALTENLYLLWVSHMPALNIIIVSKICFTLL